MTKWTSTMELTPHVVHPLKIKLSVERILIVLLKGIIVAAIDFYGVFLMVFSITSHCYEMYFQIADSPSGAQSMC